MITNLIQTLTRQHIMVLTDSRYFVPMLIITDIYKGLGWGTIIYFAAISGIDPSLYEALRSTEPENGNRPSTLHCRVLYRPLSSSSS